MKSFLLAAAALAAAAFAVPSGYPGEHCLSKKEAAHVAENFKDLISLPFNKTLALTALAKDCLSYYHSLLPQWHANQLL